jgi:lipopolysaccharide heptosyltransferase I
MSEPNQRFLVIRLSSIGDIVHTLPAVSALGESFPRAEIHWLIEKRHASLVEGNPYVHRLVKLDTLGWRKDPFSPATLEQLAGSAMALREVAFDAAIDFQGLLKSAFLARFSRSPLRLGFSEKWLREPAAGVFYTDRVTPRGRQHVIAMNLSLVERLGAPPLSFEKWKFPLPQDESDNRWVDNQLASLEAREFIVLNPGGGWKSKRWAPENYSRLIRRLEEHFSGRILLTGSPDEAPLIDEIIRSADSARASYFPSTLRQLITLVRRAKLFVGGDTGPVHLAAAAGTPVVTIFNAADPLNTPERNGPFAPRDITVAARNGMPRGSLGRNADYLRDVSVESVLAAVLERLAREHE